MGLESASGSRWTEYAPGPDRPAAEGPAEAGAAVFGAGIAGLCPGGDDGKQAGGCPRHGARVAVAGQVVRGPAARPLERVGPASAGPERSAHEGTGR
ncbi:hypothetical protein C6N75_29395 [Streptomyces solincola]|uniref:Uncharacterized protein n=1 Tax=Streptomyces solincola TaxID=2100817 RepID=A0A2S9PMU9_9ACTN|nr:hypothetical protein C6N75_29395 [Streptomyces solincola]